MQNDHLFVQVICAWNWLDLKKVNDLVEAMVEWHREGYIDPAVWEYIRSKMNPTLMPSPSVLQALPVLIHPGKSFRFDGQLEVCVDFLQINSTILLALLRTFSCNYFLNN